ncbi:MerR-like helix-turn-helix DNA binding domain protein [Arthrobacter phage Taj14]|nr:MerR-like helix-turn-helix DNA binding domain protein [Arthrobacter phage Taj14]ASR84002.1 MerR-like helix-turn-helix DNA binding domain protein [Arthrobacter phage Swenson]QGH75243.1 MerR-like helix-turn-helix DNA binding domain protein [Arthrobacter phage Saphira]
MPEGYSVQGMTEHSSETTELVEAAQAAVLLGVSKRTLDRYQAAGLITPIRPIQGKGAIRRFDAQDVQRLAVAQDGQP